MFVSLVMFVWRECGLINILCLTIDGTPLPPSMSLAASIFKC